MNAATGSSTADRDDRTVPELTGRVVLVAPVNTWQAYNQWGGYSLYHGPSGDRRAWAVSFDRPYVPENRQPRGRHEIWRAAGRILAIDPPGSQLAPARRLPG